jgi:hypothetical protein
MWESLGFIIAFAYSNFICTRVKIIVMLAVLVIGNALYFVVEYRQLHTHGASSYAEAQGAKPLQGLDNPSLTTDAEDLGGQSGKQGDKTQGLNGNRVVEADVSTGNYNEDKAMHSKENDSVRKPEEFDFVVKF